MEATMYIHWGYIRDHRTGLILRRLKHLVLSDKASGWLASLLT